MSVRDKEIKRRVKNLTRGLDELGDEAEGLHDYFEVEA